MLRRRIVCFVSGFLLIISNAAAYGWGADGHKVIGSIADQLLNPNAKQDG
jgi:hypothetical protein